MSRLGKSPIALPKGVEIKTEGGKLHVKGPKGATSYPLERGITVKVEDSKVFVERDEKVEMPRTTHGLYRALINNMIIGVSTGFEKKLSLIGVGYRAAIAGHMLDLQLGFSHPTKIEIPKSVKVEIEKSVAITISGIDKHAVGQFAAAVRAMKPPEPYKGKGIRYENEYVRKKDGKAAKGKTAAA
ncbi:MAG: 50S ribosomal protein L6 [Chlamydiales bacterium]|nr:50S ribosomal protein L6 [Chlamydiales bacterium]